MSAEDWKKHYCRIGNRPARTEDSPPEASAEDEALWGIEDCRRDIEPWLSAIFQSEHLSLLVGNGLAMGVSFQAEVTPASMVVRDFGGDRGSQITLYADKIAQAARRGSSNIEDQIHAALTIAAGLEALGQAADALDCQNGIDRVMAEWIKEILRAEADLRAKIVDDPTDRGKHANELLCGFLLSFASRAATRDRLHVFTTNYDRLIEFGCDWIGLRIIDRFVGRLSPIFRASRLGVDIHYNPPGIRGEARYLEGVVRLTKLHGSIDWRYKAGVLRRVPLAFGAPDNHPDLPQDPSQSVVIYPNPAKDVETTEYPYAELFRDFSAAICRPNSSLVTYGYGFGDDHINRVIRDMLTLPSTNLVIISWDEANAGGLSARIRRFCDDVGHTPQITLLLGNHFGDLETLVANYLPKPAIDRISTRETNLLRNRGQLPQAQESGADQNSTTPGGQ